MMFAVVLVAFMAMAVQSCGSDDNKDQTTHILKVDLNVTDKGNLTDAEVQKLKTTYAQSIPGSYVSDKAAADKVREAALSLESTYETIAAQAASDDPLLTASFVVTLTATNTKANQVVAEWKVTWTKGEVEAAAANK